MQIPLGKITVPVPGTPVQLTATTIYQNLGTQANFKTAQAVLFQAWKANVGQTYIGGPGMVKGTGAKVMAVLVIPTASAIPAFGASNHLGPAALDLSEFYIDADTANDGVLVTLLVT